MDDPLNPEYRLRQLFQEVEIQPQFTLIKYFRSGPEMLSMAEIYEKEGDVEKAFMLYYKYITLFLEKIPEHHSYKDIPTIEKNIVKNALKDVLPRAEILKTKILNKYAQEQEIERERDLKRRSFYENVTSKTPNQSLYTNENHVSTAYSNSNNEHPIKSPQSSNQIINPSNVDSIHESNLQAKTLIIPSRELKPKNLIEPPTPSPTDGLRKMLVPKNLVPIFLSLAESNTDKNIETGGHLFGKLCQNIFTVTHLVIPKQTGKSDSFSAVNEEEMVYFKESKNLLTLGWIHTHPSQTAFLSSVDLHNQFPNQQLLPEYIAIVCAPKHKQVKYFTLTPDLGINILATCRETGFHYHSQNPPLYEECKHISLEPDLDVVVEDMRRI